ncbi:MAG TPA: Tim44 domain-containing protein [Thermodesulfobacteriaceae bacterium]|nr:Tim44 domain-containing protein [Thermodesulfobacteriaceae bacterium]
MLKTISILIVFSCTFIFVSEVLIDAADARARSGGRSFSGSRSFSRQAQPTRTTPPPVSGQRKTGVQSGGSSFMRGLGGGILGGFLGSMLFGGMAHGTGMGGIAGTGIGLFELILIGGLLYFLYKRFMRAKATTGSDLNRMDPRVSRESSSPFGTPPPPPSGNYHGSGGMGPTPGIDAPPPDRSHVDSSEHNLPSGSLDQQAFRDFAQDVFFKIQAGWTRRDLDLMRNVLGDELLRKYRGHIQEMVQNGTVNRLENIAVRNVEIVENGIKQDEEYVIVHFEANLLDYTIDESTGRIIDGSDSEPVRFEEYWHFARPKSSLEWKLVGIREAR